ncbi:MAG: sigma-70 family RNA polymerase sigma factor [Acidimicrobiales bacterium]
MGERDNETDAHLVRRLRHGDRAAAEHLYRRHGPTVRFVVMDNVRDRDDIDDVVQDTFARAFARVDQLTDDSCFRPWLLQIARRLSIDARRARLRRPDVTPLGDRVVIDLDAPSELLAEVEELAAALRRGLSGLSLRDRTVLSMTVELGFTLDEVAEALDITYGNAKVVLHRARARLRRSIEPLLAVG